MRANDNWGIGMLTATAILACILVPVSVAAEQSVNEQLLRAAEKGSPEEIKTLLAKGGDLNAKTENGHTVLDSASSFQDQPEVVQYLKAHGAK